MTSTEAAAKLQATRAQAGVAMASARRQAFAAGNRLARAKNASGALLDQMQAALLARDAYWQRIGAEGEKYRATYLLLAVTERKTALDAALAAQNVKNARDQRHLYERVESYSARANILEQAAERAAKAVSDVSEPEVVSYRRAQRLAIAMGTDISKPNQQPGVSVRVTPLMSSKLYNPLLNHMYTPDIRQAAGGLAGVGEAGLTPGDGTVGTSFIDSVRRALGLGVSEASKAATKAAQDAAKENPGTAVVASTAGGLLAAIAQTLGVSFDQGYRDGEGVTPAGERKFPWGAALTVLGVGAVGYALWRAA